MLCCSRMAGRKVTKKMTASVVTPKLLEEALAASEARLETKFVTLEGKFVTLEGKFVTLEEALTATEERINTRFVTLENALREDFRTEMRHHFIELNRTMGQLRIDINSDTLRSIQSVEESYRTRTAAVDDKYRDLPERVTALEHAVGIKRP
jgi:chromosome segregation ATPase